jgi:hypothetical protein
MSITTFELALFDDTDEAAGLRADMTLKVDVDGVADDTELTEAVMKPEGILDVVGKGGAGDVRGIAGLLAGLAGVEETDTGPPPCTRNGCAGVVA